VHGARATEPNGCPYFPDCAATASAAHANSPSSTRTTDAGSSNRDPSTGANTGTGNRDAAPAAGLGSDRRPDQYVMLSDCMVG
jgi:hypothetical protein